MKNQYSLDNLSHGDAIVFKQSCQLVDTVNRICGLVYLNRHKKPIALENCIIAAKAEHVLQRAKEYILNDVCDDMVDNALFAIDSSGQNEADIKKFALAVRCKLLQFIERVDYEKKEIKLFKDGTWIPFSKVILAVKVEHVNKLAIDAIVEERKRSSRRSGDDTPGMFFDKKGGEA